MLLTFTRTTELRAAKWAEFEKLDNENESVVGASPANE